jgi:hypothetical protein
VIQNVLLITGQTFHIPVAITQAMIQAIEVIGMGTTVVIVLVQRWCGRMRPEIAVFVLTATILVIMRTCFPGIQLRCFPGLRCWQSLYGRPGGSMQEEWLSRWFRTLPLR